MNDPFLEEIVRLSDALLNAVRPAHPDFELVRKLAEKRGTLLAQLRAPRPDEKQQRTIVFEQIMAKDALVRARIEARRQQVSSELGTLARAAPLPRRQMAGPTLIDQRI